MNGHCDTCDVERECGYKYKPTECCNYRKFTPIKLYEKPAPKLTLVPKSTEKK